VLAHHNIVPTSPTLSFTARRAALAFAEAILPGSAATPAADETTVARLEQILRGISPTALRGFVALLVALDEAARLVTTKPFHALPRAQQKKILDFMEHSPTFAGPLHTLTVPFKTAHFELPRTYLAAGGEIHRLDQVETYRWESQIRPAAQWKEDRDIECDVVVIGTGAGGGVVGRELADRGHAVVFVEEGKRRLRSEYVGTAIHTHTHLYRNGISLGNAPIVLFMGKIVGGSTAVNGGTCLRPPPFILEAWCDRLCTDDFSVDGLKPYFDRVDQMLMVSEPERRHIGPIADVFDRGGKALGWKVGPVPRNAVGCEGQGFCDFGCASGAKRGVDIAYLPGALEKGALILSEARAERVMIEDGRAVGVEAQDTTGRTFRIRAKAVVLAAGGIPSPAFLLKQGIAGSSGQVGKNLSVHPSVGAGAQFDEVLDPQHHIPQGYMMTEFLRDGNLVLAGQPDATIGHLMFPFTGERLMRSVDSVAHLALFGVLIRDDSRGRVWRNAFGHPVVTYNINRVDIDRMHRAIIRTAELCLAAGAKRIYTGLLGSDTIDTPAQLDAFKRRRLRASELVLVAYHFIGTCRMGRDPRTSVVDIDHQTHDVPGLFVVDGSTVPGPPGVNPQIIIMAMATRAAERIHAHL
jgi:hypothetical protein